MNKIKINNFFEKEDFWNYQEEATGIIKDVFSFYKTDFYHSLNVAKICEKWAKKKGFSKKATKVMFVGGIFHDIGKATIDKKILNKGKFKDRNDYRKIQTHTIAGSFLIGLGSDERNFVRNVTLFHHERPDGNGYFKENKIDDKILMLSIVDAFDVIYNGRHYSFRKNFKETLEELAKHSGKQFDEKLLLEFFEYFNEEEIKKIYKNICYN